MRDPRIRRLVQRLERDHDAEAAIELIPFIKQHPASPDLHPILASIYAQLGSPFIKSGNPPAMPLAAMLLACVVAVHVHVDERYFASMIPPLINSWPDIWRNVLRQHEAVVEDVYTDESIRHLAAQSNLNVLLLFSLWHDALRQAAGTTRGVVAMLIRLSQLELETGSHHPEETDDPISALIELIPIMGQCQPPRWDEEVINPISGGAQTVARIALAHLRYHIALSPRDSFRIGHITAKITYIRHLSNNERIRRAMVSQHSIQTLVGAMASLPSRSEDALSLERSTSSVSEACRCLLGHIFSYADISGVMEALEANIFPVLMGCGSWLVANDRYYLALLQEDLPKFVIYPSIRRAMKKSLRRFDEECLQPTPSSSSLRTTVWAFYKRLVGYTSVLSTIHDVAIKHIPKACANLTCGKLGTGDALRSCAACHRVHYCSKACQTEHWKSGHRSYCKQIKAQSIVGEIEPISTKNLYFLCVLATQELKLRYRRILRTCIEHKISPAAVEVDYCLYPPRITVTPASYRTGIYYITTEENRQDWDKFAEEAKQTSGLIMRFLFPTGGLRAARASQLMLPQAELAEGIQDYAEISDLLDGFIQLNVLGSDGTFSPVT